MQEDLLGIKAFVVRFLIQMAKDFATRSVEISDQSQGEGFSKPKISDCQCWENLPHPYILFNNDGHIRSFFDFRLDDHSKLIDEHSGQVLVQQSMTRALYNSLTQNFVVFNRSVNQKLESDKLTGQWWPRALRGQ